MKSHLFFPNFLISSLPLRLGQKGNTNPALSFLHTEFCHSFHPEGFLKCSINFRTGGTPPAQPHQLRTTPHVALTPWLNRRPENCISGTWSLDTSLSESGSWFWFYIYFFWALGLPSRGHGLNAE